jgi:DNA polymerase II
MSITFRGWLLQLYEDSSDGVRLWFISDTGERVCLSQPMSVTFYATGANEQLRALWKTLRRQPGVISLSRVMRRDVFLPEDIPLLQAVVDNPIRQTKIFRDVQDAFPHLTYYDADIDVSTRCAASVGLVPMAFCDVEVDDSNTIQTLHVRNTRWDLVPNHPVFHTLSIEPSSDPAREEPNYLRVSYNQRWRLLSLLDPNLLITRLNEIIELVDPDIIYTQWGDTWVIPRLLQMEKQTSIKLHLNRDAEREVRWQKELTYFSYGQIVYRAPEAHFFGRCHIDKKNAMMWKDYGLDGVLESALVTAQPIEKAARVSPGSGISAMQMITALEQQILIPWHKQQVETFKTGIDLIQRDRGGLVYQPIIGLHEDVGQLDFISMYPAVIIKGNISPEIPLPDGITPSRSELGVVPLTLKPLYEKRVALKMRLAKQLKNDPIAKRDTARASALKWLLVVCFGFLGYKNARFGRIESHEAVTAGGREVLLMAKEVAEEMGYEVLHLFVDALWVKRPGARYTEDFHALQEEITARTGLGITLDGVYRWVAFLPSRMDGRTPVANRYFGVFKNGELKVRGIELRRRDTPLWVKEVQTEMLKALVEAHTMENLREKAAKAFKIFNAALNDLRTGQVPMEKLVVTSRISKKLERYKSSTPAVRAARQLLEQTGRRVEPGQRMRFVYTSGTPDVCPWEIPNPLDPSKLDQEKYIELLARAASSVLYPFGVKEEELKRWAHTSTIELPLSFERRNDYVRALHSDVRQRRTGGRIRYQTYRSGLATQRERFTG